MSDKKPRVKNLSEPILRCVGILSKYDPLSGVDPDKLISRVISDFGYSSCCYFSIEKCVMLMCEGAEFFYLNPLDLLIYLNNHDSASKSMTLKNHKPSPTTEDRDSPTWVAVELSVMGENRLEEGVIDKIIRKQLGVEPNYPIYVPRSVYRNEDEMVSLHLLNGYIFIRSGLPETSYFKLESTMYVSRVLSEFSSNGIRTLSVISDKTIKEMEHQIKCLSVNNLVKGSQVTVTDGGYRGIDMTVMDIMGDKALLKSTGLRSIEIVTVLPISYLSSRG